MKNKIEKYIDRYLKETTIIACSLDKKQIYRVMSILNKVKKERGRVFVLGIGGSAANASHLVNDLRKISGIEAYTPVDNVAELTARTNDDSFESIFIEWLKTSKLNKKDVVIILSVGGGSSKTSENLVFAMGYANNKNAKIISIVSRDGGYAKELSDECILIPVISKERITPHAEGFQGIIWHLIVNGMVIE